MSDSEKRQMRQESLISKAKGYALKLHDYPDSYDKILENLAGEMPDDIEELKKLVWNCMVERIDNEQNLMDYLERMQGLPFAPPIKSVLDRFRASVKVAQKDKSKDRKTLIERERKKLAESGISGSAVLPKLSKASEEQGINELIANLKKELVI